MPRKLRQAQPSRRPRRAPRLTLRQRLTLALLVVGLSSLSLVGAAYVVFDLAGYRKLQRDRLQQQTTLITSRIASTGLDEKSAADLTWSLHLQSDPHVLSATLYDADGSFMSAYERGRIERLDALPSLLDRFWTTTVVRDIYRDGKKVGSVRLVGNSNLVWKRVKNDGAMLIVLGGVSILLTLTLARSINRRFSDQILDLAHAANAISARQDYSIRVVRRSDDEIGILVDTFNHMIRQVEQRDRQLKTEVQRAEAAKVSKANFLATMSHEIRTPINGILGMVELLNDTEQTVEQAEFTKTVKRSADGLLAIINDILHFSKGEAGQFDLEYIPFSLSTVVNECLETVSIVAAEKGIELCCRVDRRLPGRVIGDPSRLRQVMLNLLSNALKFTNKGEVELRASLEGDFEDRVEVRIEVQDTGIGIPEDRVDRLFKSFSQVDASNTRKYGGTGLGLAICKQIIEAMGGSVYVRTTEHVGSTFGFRIRLRKDAKSLSSDGIEKPVDLRILVAAENATTRNNLVYMLEEGNSVVGVGTGREARVALLRAHQLSDEPFDLILMDLPLIEDFQAAGGRRERDLPHVPLVLLASVTQLKSAAAVSWDGPTASLARPVKEEELFWCLRQVLSPDAPDHAESFHRDKAGEDAPDVTGVTVLVAEDHPVNQKIASLFLDKLGIDWTLVDNGQEAVEAVKKSSFELVLMDVQMPVMDGIEATLAIRRMERETGLRVPIVAMTANSSDRDKKRCREAGFDDYLVKPVKLDDLRAHIHKWTRGAMAA